MLNHASCPGCNGSGVVILQSRALFGLMTKETPTTCTDCGGKGATWELAQCRFCKGQGLIGNESEVCRSCNGTGHADTFSFIPREQLRSGVEFHRRCEKCGNHSFRLRGGLQQIKVIKSWDAHEELRQVEFQDACEVECTQCAHHYSIPVDAQWHQELESDQYAVLEDRGIDLSFLYARR